MLFKFTMSREHIRAVDADGALEAAEAACYSAYVGSCATIRHANHTNVHAVANVLRHLLKLNATLAKRRRIVRSASRTSNQSTRVLEG